MQEPGVREYPVKPPEYAGQLLGPVRVQAEPAGEVLRRAGRGGGVVERVGMRALRMYNRG